MEQILEEHALDALVGRLVDPLLRELADAHFPDDSDQRLAPQLEAVAWLYTHILPESHPKLEVYSADELCKKLVILRGNLSQYLADEQRACKSRVLKACENPGQVLDSKLPARVAVLLLSSSQKECLIVKSLVTKAIWSFVEAELGQDANVLDAALAAIYKHTGIDKDSLIVESTYREARCVGQTSECTRLYTMICKESDVQIKPSSFVEEDVWISVDELRSRANSSLLETAGWGVTAAAGVDYFHIRPLLPPHASGKDNDVQTKSETTDISCEEDKKQEEGDIKQNTEEGTDTAKDPATLDITVSWSNQSPDPQDLSSPTNPSPAVTQQRKTRHRWTPSRNHLHILERLFKQGSGTPNKQRVKEITGDLVQYGEISEANVYNWFQNRKAKEKKLMQQRSHSQRLNDGESEAEPPEKRLRQDFEASKNAVKSEPDLDHQPVVSDDQMRETFCATNLEGKERRRSTSDLDTKRLVKQRDHDEYFGDEEDIELLFKLKDPVQDLDDLCLRSGLPTPSYKVQSTPHKSTQYLYTATVQLCTLRHERSAVGTPSVDFHEAKVSAASRMLGRLYLERSRFYANA